MSIQQPRRFVTTDQGHADVLNGPIDTLYANDLELAAQVENIKKDPAGNGVASKEALDNHASNTELHVTAAKQAVWNAAEGNAKKYTDQYAAPKQHSHPASDLPSASTQARGIVQLNTSMGSTATDQAATPSAVKAANDRANEAYSRADQAFTQASDLKSKIANAITGKGGSANSGMTGDQLAASILNMPTKRFASGTFNGQSAQSSGMYQSVDMNVSVSTLAFTPSMVIVRVVLSDSADVAMINAVVISSSQASYSATSGNHRINSSLTQNASGFRFQISGSLGGGSNGNAIPKVKAYEWWAFE
ncbi:tail fiber protein [Paenibacillus peoriae]|uniref:tail fiber protein n=1 Tax=Paenibacillus peoriae TaxID=59893 RepID=UPI00096D86BB|nr:phage tail protein [Paenibacillus peoriae]OMF50732.1 hypothetical protein BK135_00275 [Paenibacillus peoriae]